MERFSEETKTIKFKFASFMFSLRKDLERSQEAKDIIDFLVGYDRNFESQLSTCRDFSEVFRKLGKFVSFFDYDLLECLSDEFGSNAIKKKLEDYKDYFEEFSKRHVSVCPSDAFGECEESEVLVVVADKFIQDLTLGELRIFKYKVSKILGNKLVIVRCIQGGSIVITFQIFEKTKFILTQEQRVALKKEGVREITCGDQLILSPGML